MISFAAHGALLAAGARLSVDPISLPTSPTYVVGWTDPPRARLDSARPELDAREAAQDAWQAAAKDRVAEEFPALPMAPCDPWHDAAPAAPDPLDPSYSIWAPPVSAALRLRIGAGGRNPSCRPDGSPDGRPGSAGTPAPLRPSAPSGSAPRTGAGTPRTDPPPQRLSTRSPPRPLDGECDPPDYPRASRRNGEQGTVIVRIRISADGHVEEARVHQSSGHPRLDEAALEAISAWRFSPAREDDRPVPGVLDVPVGFRLE